MRAEISRALLDRLLAEAEASSSQEVCGLLFGGAEASQAYDEPGLWIADAISTPNVAANPADSFEIDPVALFAAIRAERTGGPRIIGHYHSHPHGPARPSARDAAAALEPGRLWLILGAERATAWRATPGGAIGGAFEAVTLSVLP